MVRVAPVHTFNSLRTSEPGACVLRRRWLFTAALKKGGTLMKDFSGKIAAVTGGGSGMGRELGCRLVAEGYAEAMRDVSTRGMAGASPCRTSWHHARLQETGDRQIQRRRGGPEIGDLRTHFSGLNNAGPLPYRTGGISAWCRIGFPWQAVDEDVEQAPVIAVRPRQYLPHTAAAPALPAEDPTPPRETRSVAVRSRRRHSPSSPPLRRRRRVRYQAHGPLR
jgi:hypothetical protein